MIDKDIFWPEEDSRDLFDTVNCNFAAIPAIVAVVGLAVSGVGMLVQYSAQQQAAANAMAVANYNAQVQAQNAQIAYQMQLAQAQQAAAIAANNAALARQQQQVALFNRQVAQNQAAVMAQNAQIQRDQAENVREQQREEARRMREESERRIAAIRAKYAGSGVTFEGSPLTVLADAARLEETRVQDAAYIAELENRKLQRAAQISDYNAHLLQAQGEAQFALDMTASRVAEANYQSQIQAATYDSLIAGAKNKIALNAAELTRFEGAVQASAYQAQATTSLISGFGGMLSSVESGFSPGGAFSNLYKPTPTYGLVS